MVFVGGFWRRLGAAIVDGVCLAPAILLLCWLASRVGGLELPAQLRFESLLELFLEGGGLVYSLLAVVIIIILVYGFLFTVTTGATPGLKLFGLKVINVYGEAPQWWRAMLRGGGLLLGGGLLGLGLLWVGFDREKRGLHDWLAGTYVIRASRSD
jgi:uncharacterized RDD family membrane protein YckC